MDEAIEHCTKGVGVWDWASSDQGSEPDVVMACAGDVPTLELSRGVYPSRTPTAIEDSCGKCCRSDAA